MKPHRFHPEANEEYVAAAVHYANIGSELGIRFFEEIERLIGDVCNAPGRFRRVGGEVRRHLADDFPYALLFIEESDSVLILAIMPLRREPDYWKRRLTG